jgi:hypothetical protein
MKRFTSSVGIVAALSLATLSGCYSRALIPTSELPKLNGFDSTRPSATPVIVKDDDGNDVDFSQHPRLYLEMPNGEVGGDFGKIRVANGRFQGTTESGESVQANLSDVDHGDDAQFSVGLTIAAVATVLAVGTVAAWAIRGPSCTDDSGCL